MKKYLSIIIPLYNTESYILDCLNSIYSQGLAETDFEVIIVNDGSTDSSEIIVNEFSRNHTNIKLVRQVNQGQSAARNRGIKEAVGTYICFLDADDYWIPESFAVVYDYLKNNINSTDIPDLITYGISVGNKPYGDFTLTKFSIDNTPIYYQNGLEYISKNNYNNGPWWYLLKKVFVIENDLHFQEGKLCEDGMFTMETLLKAGKITQFKTNDVYYYVIRPNSTMTSQDVNKREKVIEGFIYAIDFFQKLIAAQSNLPQKCLARLQTRVNRYEFFLLARIMKSGDAKRGLKIIKRLKSKGLYPLRHHGAPDYPQFNLKIITGVFNTPALYIIGCILFRIKNRLTKA